MEDVPPAPQPRWLCHGRRVPRLTSSGRTSSAKCRGRLRRRAGSRSRRFGGTVKYGVPAGRTTVAVGCSPRSWSDEGPCRGATPACVRGFQTSFRDVGPTWEDPWAAAHGKLEKPSGAFHGLRRAITEELRSETRDFSKLRHCPSVQSCRLPRSTGCWPLPRSPFGLPAAGYVASLHSPAWLLFQARQLGNESLSQNTPPLTAMIQINHVVTHSETYITF